MYALVDKLPMFHLYLLFIIRLYFDIIFDIILRIQYALFQLQFLTFK